MAQTTLDPGAKGKPSPADILRGAGRGAAAPEDVFGFLQGVGSAATSAAGAAVRYAPIGRDLIGIFESLRSLQGIGADLPVVGENTQRRELEQKYSEAPAGTRVKPLFPAPEVPTPDYTPVLNAYRRGGSQDYADVVADALDRHAGIQRNVRQDEENEIVALNVAMTSLTVGKAGKALLGGARAAGTGAGKVASQAARRFIVEPKPSGGASVIDATTGKVSSIHAEMASAEAAAAKRNAASALKGAPKAPKPVDPKVAYDEAKLDAAVGGVSPDVKSMLRKVLRGEDGQTIDSLTAEQQQRLFAAQHKALSGVGMAVDDITIQGLMDRLVVQANKINGVTAARGRKLTTTEQAVVKAAAPKVEAPIANKPYPSSVQSGVGPIIQKVRPGATVQEPATTLFNAAPEGLRPNPNLSPPSGPPPGITYMGGFGAGGDESRIVKQVFENLLNIPKTARATLDISQLGRQGLIPIVSAAISRSPTRRLIARDAFVNAVRGYSDKYAGEVWERVAKDSYYQKWKARGGNETAIPGKSTEHLQVGARREEIFTPTILEDIPGVRSVVSASNRSFALTLNALSFYRWKDAVQTIERSRKASGGLVTKVEEEALARWYNAAAGRGKFIQSDSKILNGIFWAPNFVISRFAAPVYVAKFLANPATREVGKIAAKDMGKTVAAGIGFLAAADAAGLKVNWDRTSSEFLTVRVGDTTIDPWAGYRQPFVLAARIALDQITSRSGETNALSEAQFGQPDVSQLIWRFQESKFSPTVSMAIALAGGRDFVGEPFGPRGGQTPEEFAKALASGSVVPLGPADFAEAIINDLVNGTSVEHGLPPGAIGFGTGLLALGGVGVQTYDRPTYRDGIGREVAGDQDEPPPHPVLDVWAAARTRAVERAERAGGTAEFPELVRPDKYIGTGEDRIELDEAEADRLAVLVGQERDRSLTPVVTSPAFLSLDPRSQETTLKSIKREADRMGQEALSIEIALNATDDVGLVRAADIGLRASQGTGDRMDFIAKMSRAGALTPEMEGALDDLRSQTDPTKPKYEPTVNELLTWSVNAQRYAQAPPWKVGDPSVWATVARQASRLRAIRADLTREADTKGVPIQTLPDYKQYAQDYGATIVGAQPNGQPLKVAAFIDLSGDARKAMLSNARAQIEALPLWDRFRDAVKSRDPYAIR